MKLYCFFNKNNSLVAWATGSADYGVMDDQGNMLRKETHDVPDNFNGSEENVKQISVQTIQ